MRLTPRRLILVALAAIAVLVLVPSVQGQNTATTNTQLDLTIAGFTEPDGSGSPYLPVPIAPGQSRTFTLYVNYSWAAGGYSVDQTQIHLRTNGRPGWIRPSLGKTLVLADPPDTPGQAGKDTVRVNLTISISDDAPAFNPDFLFVEARAEANADAGRGNLEKAPSDSQWKKYSPLVTAGVLEQVRVTPAERLVQIRGGETRTIAVEVENSGNVNLTTALTARNVPDNVDVQLPRQVTIPVGQTITRNMTITVNDILAGGQASFVIEARPRYAEGNATASSTVSRTEVSLSMKPLPTAVLLGQQTIFEVFLFTAIFVTASFAAAWPMTHWYEERRKSLGKKPFGAGGSSRSSRDRSSDDDDGGASAERASGTVHGVPREGEDYEVVEETEIWDDDAETAGSGAEDAEVEIVDDDDIFER